MNHYTTNNYDIFYKKKIYKINTSIETELLRRHYYLLLVKEFIEKCNGILSDKKLSEIFAYFIITANNVDDPILTNKPKFSLSTIVNILKNNININEHKKMFLNVLKQLEKRMIEYYNTFSKSKHGSSFTVKQELKGDLIIIKLIQLGVFCIPVPNLTFSIHISLYKHLIKLYSIRNYNEYKIPDTVVPWIEQFLKHLFILYCRYNYLSSGATQASVPAKFKKMLTEKLNIKVELFASAINSSYMNYCSLFYDIEQYFGSLGSFFDTKINAGYYEVNPPFEKTIIHNLFDKMSKELDDAELAKRGLLFFIIIHKTNLGEFSSFIKMKKYLKYERLLNKNEFSYVYYDSTFSYAITRNIIDSQLLIYHTSYIKEPVKKNVKHFNPIL